MKTFLVVGKNFSGLKNKIEERGDNFIVLRDKATLKNPEKKLKQSVVVDFSDNKALIEAVDELEPKIDGVITIYENYVLAAAEIAQHLNLPGMPIEAAKACTDKALMRAMFDTAPETISPDYAVVEAEDDLRTFADSHQFPLILKPANLQKSLLVTKNDSLDELIDSYRDAIQRLDEVYSKYAPGRKPKIVVEEYLEGPVHSVDAFIEGDGTVKVLENVVDYQTGYDIGYDDNFHYSRLLPSRLSQPEQAAIRHTAKLACEALGMKNSPAHIEIIRTPKGPRVVEVGARNGGYRERMHRLANGLDIVSMALDIVCGQVVDIRPKKNEPCAVLELFPKTPGIFSGIGNDDELKNLASLTYFAVKQPIGEHVGKSSEGYKMCAIIILHNKDSEQFQADLDFINDKVAVITSAK